MSTNAYAAALGWYHDQGIDEVLDDSSVNKRELKPREAPFMKAPAQSAVTSSGFSEAKAARVDFTPPVASASAAPPVADISSNSSIAATAAPAPAFLGKSDAVIEAISCAKKAETIGELKTTIYEFDGLAIKTTASNMVFAAGIEGMDIMMIGEVPSKDDDREGEAFTGEAGALLDKMLGAIELTRADLYLTNFINWRPPGGRSPNPAEIEVSLPFIEKHIALAKPKLLVLCGGTVAKALLGKSESISRLRKKWHDYEPQTEDIGIERDTKPIPAIVTYTPAYLIGTPTQKRAAWEDLLKIKEKLGAL